MALLTHAFFGFAAKWLVPNVHILLLLLAPMISDILFFTYVALGIERYPDISIWVHVNPGEATIDPGNWDGFSHGLAMTIVYSILFGLLLGFSYRSFKVGIVYGLLVLSHFPVDLLCHPMKILFGRNAPIGMPIFLDPRGDVLLGYGLWQYPIVVIVGELGMLFAGIVLYVAFRLKKSKRKLD